MIRGYYLIAGLYTLSAALIWGVNTLFLLSAGLWISQVFIANAAFSIGMVVFEIPTGVVADTLDRRISFLLSVVVLGITTLAYVALAQFEAGVLAFSLVSVFMELGFTFDSAGAEVTQLTRDSIKYGWNQPGLRGPMCVGFVQTAFITWGFYAWQPYFLEMLGEDAVWVAGLVSALISLSTMAGNAVVEVFTRFCGKRTTLLIWGSSLMAVAAVAVGLATEFWMALPALLVVTGSLGLMGPVRQSYFHHLVPADKRATVLSFDSMVAGTGGASGQFGLGQLAGSYSISAGYVVGGLFSSVALPIVFWVRGLGGPADEIVGSNAGVEGGCAAQGLPGVTSVNSAAPPEVEVGALPKS